MSTWLSHRLLGRGPRLAIDQYWADFIHDMRSVPPADSEDYRGSCRCRMHPAQSTAITFGQIGTTVGSDEHDDI
jgi:hypothetical protein